MKRSLVKDAQQHQLAIFLAFTLLTSLLIGAASWRKTLRDRKASLLRMTRLIENTLQEPATVRRLQAMMEAGDAEGARQLLEPLIRPIVESYRIGFTAGFYSRSLDRVIVGYSRDQSVQIVGRRLPSNDPGRATWSTGNPSNRLLYSKIRRAYILKCDNPFVVDGTIIGHTFANLTLADLFTFYQHAVLILFLCTLASGLASLLISRGFTNRILRNVDQLSRLDERADLPPFEYEELDRVARATRQTFSALQAALQQKAAMLNHFPWGYVIVDSRGAVTDVNERGAALFGYGRQQLLGRQLRPEETEPPFLTVLRDKVPLEGEYVVTLSNGKKVIYHYTFPLTLDSGEQGAMSWFLDLTETKTMQLYAQHKDRLSTVGEMTSIICHDVRNPLTSIKLIAQLARMAPDQATRVEAWAQIDETVDDIMDYLETVLAFCSPEAETAAVCSVRELFENVITMLQGKCDYSHIKIVTELSDPDLEILVNPVDFQHVLAHLVNNAFEAMSSQAQPGRIKLMADRVRGKVRVRVSDMGPGIPESELGRIWDLFYTTKPKGSGIGLVIVKNLVEQMGGRIEVSSKVGEGTTFEMLLPPALSEELPAEQAT